MSAFTPITQTGAGASPIITYLPLAVYPPVYLGGTADFQLGLVCTVAPGSSLTYSVQITADPSPSPVGNWNNHDVLVGLTNSANSNISYPVTGIRLNVTAYTSGAVTLGVARWP